MDTPDKSREGVTLGKLLQPFLIFHPRNNRALAKVKDFSSLNIAKINEAFGLKIRGVILDIDECVAPHHGDILPENLATIEQMKETMRIRIFSNMEKTARYKDVEAMGIEVHTGTHAKPDPRGFLECCEKLNLPPQEVAMIGDNFMTDGGANRAGMHFIKVRSIPTRESWGKQLKRLSQKIFRSFGNGISNTYDMILRRKVLHDQDFDS